MQQMLVAEHLIYLVKTVAMKESFIIIDRQIKMDINKRLGYGNQHTG